MMGKVQLTAETKKYKRCKVIFQILSFLLTVAPIIVYTILGFANNEIHTGNKVFLGFTLVTAIILVAINVMFKYHLRSPLFLMILGIYFALDKILPLLIIVSAGIVIDEFVFQPLIKSFKSKYQINKEIDKRIP